MSRIKSYANDKRRREVDFRGIGKEAEEINKKIGKEPCLEDISLQKRLLDPESQWNEGLALLCRNQGVKALFWLMPVYDSLNRPVRRGLRTLIAEENWLRQCAARLGTASFSPQLLGWLWQLAPDGEILPLLADMLADGDENLSAAAAEALLTVNDRRAIPYLA
ncbi:MAG: hypothetical protein FWD39_01020, partial [Clostridiales bacterium]|nr:hypothetical protein [Clostridiales bacterium]